MCVIAAAIKERIDLDTLRACEIANPHGGGVSWISNGLVHYRKGLKAEEMFRLVEGFPLPHVFHFRIASVGGVVPVLCHPFLLRRKQNSDMAGVTPRSVLFHNGTIHDWKFLARVAGVKYPDFASDSMVVARIAAVRGQEILRDFGGNKFTVMSPDGTIKFYGQFSELNGNMFSNMYWTYRKDEAARAHRSFQSTGCDCDELPLKPAAGESPNEWYDKYRRDNDGPLVKCPKCGGDEIVQDGEVFLCRTCDEMWEAGEEPNSDAETVEPTIDQDKTI